MQQSFLIRLRVWKPIEQVNTIRSVVPVVGCQSTEHGRRVALQKGFSANHLVGMCDADVELDRAILCEPVKITHVTPFGKRVVTDDQQVDQALVDPGSHVKSVESTGHQIFIDANGQLEGASTLRTAFTQRLAYGPDKIGQHG